MSQEDIEKSKNDENRLLASTIAEDNDAFAADDSSLWSYIAKNSNSLLKSKAL